MLRPLRTRDTRPSLLVLALALLAPALGLALAGSARAQTVRCVHPTSPACFNTIQAAVNASGPGDTVQIAGGVYSENVVIPAGRDFLQLVAQPWTAVLDAEAAGGDALTVRSDDVRIFGLTLRNGEACGIYLDPGHRTRIESVRFVAIADSCISNTALSHGVEVLGSQFFGCGEEGFYVDGDDLWLANNTFDNLGFAGVSSQGARIVVENNVFRVIGNDDCVAVDGHGAQIRDNRMQACDEAGVEYYGDGGTVVRNHVEHSDEDSDRAAIFVEGRDPRVAWNVVDDYRSGGIWVDCPGCASGLVADNQVTHGVRGARPAYRLDADAGGLVAERNFAFQGPGEGFATDSGSTGITLRHNRAENIGRGGRSNQGQDCYEVRGSRHTVYRNSAVYCGGDGFEVDDPDNLLDSNSATDTSEDGFDVTSLGDRTRLLSNLAYRNIGNGVEVSLSATDVVARFNVSVLNRTDVCNAGTNTMAFGNAFVTSLVPPAAQDCPIDD